MKSNYQNIGDFIQLVDNRNKELLVDTLLGLSINKVFIPSVANIVGTNMKNYKIIKKNQFACSLMQVRRDKKMPVALLKDYDQAIISQAYPVFEISDTKLLLPEYLMMWFSRSEFDRHACFLAVGGVRGSLEWEDFLDMQLPVPSPQKQAEIVAEYNTITNRIKLNEQLNKKLEETAQAIYKHWFVDFEFPDEDGKPYKTNGGKMVYCGELEKEIPEGWEVQFLGNIIEYVKGFAFKSKMYQDSGCSIVRVSDLTKRSIEFNDCYKIDEADTSKFERVELLENDIIITSVGSWATNPDSVVGKVVKSPFIETKAFLNQNMVRLRSKINKTQMLLYNVLITKEFSDHIICGAQGSANQASVTLKHIFNYKLCLPNNNIQKKLSEVFNILSKFDSKHYRENWKLIEIKNLLLIKMSKLN